MSFLKTSRLCTNHDVTSDITAGHQSKLHPHPLSSPDWWILFSTETVPMPGKRFLYSFVPVLFFFNDNFNILLTDIH